MEITVKVTKICEKQTYVSQKNGNVYISIVFVGETTTGQYTRKIAFKVMGEDKFAQMGIVVGGTYNVSFDVESREWNGRFFTDCQAWKVVRTDVVNNAPQQQQTTQAPTPQPTPTPTPSNDNDQVPF